MAGVQENEKGYNGSDDGSGQQQIYERPKGLKGLYYHPVTQVRLHSSCANNRYSYD